MPLAPPLRGQVNRPRTGTQMIHRRPPVAKASGLSTLTIVGMAALLFLAWHATESSAQPGQVQLILPGNIQAADQGYDRVRLPTDRSFSRGIQRAQERIAAGEYSQSIRFLDEVLASDQDSFVDDGAGEFTGLKQNASTMIRDLPAEGRQMYEATYGGVARRELAEALSNGDYESLRQLVQRYFYTPAGYQAAMLLARQESDRGHHLSAALIYQQLLETPEALHQLEPQLSLLGAISWLAAGEEEKAIQVLGQVSLPPGATVEISGKPQPMGAAKQQPVDWLERIVGVPLQLDGQPELQWLTSRGNAARNGRAEGGLPHMQVRWQVRLLNHPQLETVYEDVRATLEQRGATQIVAGSPLAVGDYIITRSAHNMIAIDFRTGKRVWQSQPQRVPELEELVGLATGSGQELDSSQEPVRALQRRLWDDYLYNSLSSDGHRVYEIRDLRMPESNEHEMWGLGFPGGAPQEDQTTANRLCAYDLATQGKLVWEIDGATIQNELAGAYFLGAPLSIGQNLYCLAEIKSSIRLAVIDRESGELVWWQELANLETGIQRDTARRLQASMPSHDSGILVCPTGAGVVIGVNLAKNSLAWAYRYEVNHAPVNQYRRREYRSSTTGQWTDSVAILADGRVLLTPPESESLHCLDLTTGKLLWKKERSEACDIAGVEEGRILIVGNQELNALDLKDGKPAWEESLVLPEGSTPSGRGFFSDGKYYLPLSSAEVIAVDVADGKIVSRAVSRTGHVLGNLVAHRGTIISQTGRYLDCFDQVEELRLRSEKMLAQDENDYEALRTLGEISYNEGHLDDAVSLLERAFEAAPTDFRVREALANCLTTALEQNFVRYYDRLPQLQELLSSSEQGRLALLRLEAKGLLELEQPLESFAVCLKLFDQASDLRELFDPGDGYQVQAARWIGAQLAQVWQQADADEREQISLEVAQRFDRMLQEESSLDRKLFFECFGMIGDSEAIMRDFAQQHLASNRLLEAQQMWLNLTESSNAQIRQEALLANSNILHDAGQHRLAWPYDRMLADERRVGDTDGESDELLERLASAGRVGLDWPYGKVEIEDAGASPIESARGVRSPFGQILLERTDDVLGKTNVFISGRSGEGEVVIRDSLGREIFREALEHENRQFFDTRTIYAVSRGNLLILSLGREIVALNTLGASDPTTSAVLWRKNTIRNVSDRFQYHRQSYRTPIDRPGSRRPSRAQVDGKWVGVIGPVSSDSCVYQDQRRLNCVDLMTGELKWSRSDIPAGCDLFGDEIYTIAVPDRDTKALIFSTVDGRSLGEATVPRWQDRLGTLGQDIISWSKQGRAGQVLSLTNAVTGEVHWRKQFSNLAKVDIAMDRYIAVVEPDGECLILDARDGRILVDYQLAPIGSLRQVYLFAGTDHFMLGAETSPSDAPEHRMAGLTIDFAVFNGQLAIFDRESGQPAWQKPATVRNQALMLAQPVDLPVVTFAGNIRQQGRQGSQSLLNLMLLEKASGRLLYSNNSLPASPHHFVVEAAENDDEVFVEMVGRLIRVKFTDAPRAPEPAATHESEAESGSGPKGLYRIFQYRGREGP